MSDFFNMSDPEEAAFANLEDIELGIGKNTGTELPTQTDPYALTNKAIEESNKSWRQMLIDNHTKRQEENKKRVRNAQILGIGKALGDMIGAIWGGVASSRNNATAVVPAPQASKTAEQVEKLIREGVVNAQDYDKMMLNLSMQEGKDKIALAKAMDELSLRERQLEETRAYEAKKLAEQREYEGKKLEKAHERQKELIGLRHTNTITQLRQRGENAVAAAQAKKDGDKNPSNNKFTDGDKAILGVVMPEATTKEGKYGEVEVPNKPTTNQLMLELARQKEQMKQYNLNPDKEEDKGKWAIAISSIGELAARLPQASREQLLAALVSGLTGEEIITMWNARFGNNGTK